MGTMETHTANRTMIVLPDDLQPKHHCFLLVKTTSNATLDDGSDYASIGLTQEQPEERIGSEEDPRWFCLMITIMTGH